MKAIVRMMMLLIIAMPLLASCGSKSENRDGSSGEGAATVSSATLDVDRITEISKKDSGEVTSSDFDFLLDQLEVLMKPTKDMTAGERKEYMGNLDSDAQGAMIVVAFALQAGAEKGIMSEKQMKRYSKIQQKYGGDEE